MREHTMVPHTVLAIRSRLDGSIKTFLKMVELNGFESKSYISTRTKKLYEVMQNLIPVCK